MRIQQQNPFGHSRIRTKRDINIHALLEKARRRKDPEAIQQLEELGIKILWREENK